MKTVLILASLLLGSAAQAKDTPPPPPAPQPDFAKVRQTGEATLKSTLFDPSSAQIIYTNGFQWGYAKPLIGRRKWGWIACGTLNAKNRMGNPRDNKDYVSLIMETRRGTLADEAFA